MQPGDILDGKYQIFEKIGKGGISTIFKAWHLNLQKYVVIKKIADTFYDDLDSRIEVDILKKLHHTNLPQVYDFLQVNGQIYTVMDFISGNDLKHYIESGYSFAEEQLIFWLRQILEVLVYLHEQTPPVIHCDIKPANIMITESGDVCLIDFNISLDGVYTDLLGISYQYAAPEQYEMVMSMNKRGREIIQLDERLDLYSLGAVYYRLLTGIVPQADLSLHIPLRKCQTACSDGLRAIIEKAMEPDREKRYKKARAMLEAINAIEKQDRLYKRIMTGFCQGMAACIILLALGIYFTIYGIDTVRQEEYQYEFSRLRENFEAQESTQTINQGMHILNNRDYKKILLERSEERAEILYAISNSYSRENNLTAAIYYIEEAITFADDIGLSGQYYQEYVSLLIKAGEEQRIEQVLSEASERGIASWQIEFMMGEVYIAQGMYNKALATFADIIGESDDGDVLGASYIQAALIYSMKEDYAASIEMLKHAEYYITDRNIYRQMAAYSMELALSCSNSAAALEYRKNAIKCYEKLCNMQNAADMDKLNLAILYIVNQQNYDAEIILEDMNGKEDYRIYMYLTYAHLNIQNEKKQELRDYQSVLSYYQKAEETYEKAGYPTDDNMQQLRIVVKELK